jgi:hypothetical protein
MFHFFPNCGFFCFSSASKNDKRKGFGELSMRNSELKYTKVTSYAILNVYLQV